MAKPILQEEIKDNTVDIPYIQQYIYMHYPQDKQNSDLADKVYFENILKASGFNELEKTVVEKVINFKKGTSLNELLSDVEDANKEAIGQLIKVGIRVDWVQMCKAELRASILAKKEAKYPEFPEV